MTARPDDMSPRAFALSLLITIAVAGLLRGLFPAADPPWNPAVGVVWHDEGAWVHNARNKRFSARGPRTMERCRSRRGFTGPSTAFSCCVGGRQDAPRAGALRTGPVLLLALGWARLAGRAGRDAEALLGTNYVYVIGNRAALMEGPW